MLPDSRHFCFLMYPWKCGSRKECPVKTLPLGNYDSHKPEIIWYLLYRNIYLYCLCHCVLGRNLHKVEYAQKRRGWLRPFWFNPAQWTLVFLKINILGTLFPKKLTLNTPKSYKQQVLSKKKILLKIGLTSKEGPLTAISF